MSDNELFQLSHYHYTVPQTLVAQTPTGERPDARLMIVNRKDETIRHSHVRDILEFLKPEDCLVLNNTKVLPARLIGRRAETDGHWEGLFIDADEHGIWKVMGKTRGKLKSGEKIVLQTPSGRSGFFLEIITQQDDGNWLVKPITNNEENEIPSGEFSRDKNFAILNKAGWVPIPPYIRNGRMMPSDAAHYQTVYASKPGAIAAPTAGLHFSPELLSQIQNIGVDTIPITLHVGIGTFRPISVEKIDEHIMHSEWCEITEKAVERINQRKKAGGRVIAVGTTSVRTLESATDSQRVLQPFCGMTNLFIKPGYNFRVVDSIMTNFHYPSSTLLILVRTFGGDTLLRRAYEEAIAEQYRFYSYGDAMLIL